MIEQNKQFYFNPSLITFITQAINNFIKPVCNEFLLFLKPFLLGNDKKLAFWKKMAKYKHTDLNKVFVKKECEKYMQDEKELTNENVPTPFFSLVEDRIKITDVVHDSTACPNCCGISITIPYSKYKEFYLILNPDFVRYFPRFVEAKLLSKDQAKNYLKLLK